MKITKSHLYEILQNEIENLFLLFEGVQDDLKELKAKYKEYEKELDELQIAQTIPSPKSPQPPREIFAIKDREEKKSKLEKWKEDNEEEIRSTKEKIKEVSAQNKEISEKNEINARKIKWLKSRYGDSPIAETSISLVQSLEVLERFFSKKDDMRRKMQEDEDYENRIKNILQSNDKNLFKGGLPQKTDVIDEINFTAGQMNELYKAASVGRGEIQLDFSQAKKDFVASVGDWNIFMPTTVGSSCAIGQGTTWCTSRTSGNNLLYNYLGRPTQDIVLFYVIKKGATEPEKNPEHFQSVGFINGRRHERGTDGNLSVNADNKGKTPLQFAAIVGQDAEEIEKIMQEKVDEIGGLHPVKERIIKAGQDMKTFRSLFNKGMGGDEIEDIISNVVKTAKAKAGVSPWAGYKEGILSPEVENEIKKGIKFGNKTFWTPFIFNQVSAKQYSIEDLDFEGVEFYSNTDFSLGTFRRCNFKNAVFKKIRFSKNLEFYECNFEGAVFEGAVFDECRFESDIDLTNCQFKSCEFSLLRFRNVKSYSGCVFDNVKSSGSKIQLEEANDVKFIDTYQVSLDESVITDDTFTFTDSSNYSNLVHAECDTCTFKGDFKKYNPFAIENTHCIFDGVSVPGQEEGFHRYRVKRGKFENCSLSMTTMNVGFEKCKFSNTKVSYRREDHESSNIFNMCSFDNVYFEELQDLELRNCVFSNVEFNSVMRCRFFDSKFSVATFEGRVYESDFSNCTLNKIDFSSPDQGPSGMISDSSLQEVKFYLKPDFIFRDCKLEGIKLPSEVSMEDLNVTYGQEIPEEDKDDVPFESFIRKKVGQVLFEEITKSEVKKISKKEAKKIKQEIEKSFEKKLRSKISKEIIEDVVKQLLKKFHRELSVNYPQLINRL